MSDGSVSNLCSYWLPDLDSVWEFLRFDKAWWLATLPERLWSGRGSLLEYDLYVVGFLVFGHLFVAVIWVHWASRPFFFSFFVQICCVQQSCTPVRGSALIQWVPNPLAHQGKPASTWSSKGQHVLMENFLSFEPACSYPRIKQNFTHGELPFLWAGLFISLNQAEFCSWLKTFSIRFYCTVGTKSCDSFSVLRQSLLLT